MADSWEVLEEIKYSGHVFFFFYIHSTNFQALTLNISINIALLNNSTSHNWKTKQLHWKQFCVKGFFGLFVFSLIKMDHIGNLLKLKYCIPFPSLNVE